jgi:hypothetical protein
MDPEVVKAAPSLKEDIPVIMLDGRVVIFYSTPTPKTIDEKDAQLQHFMLHAGLPFVTGDTSSRNPHRFAEALRYEARTKMASLMTQELRKSKPTMDIREENDFIVLWPSNTEVSAYESLVKCKVFGTEDEKSARVAGYRLSLLGTDAERGRIVYPTSLASSTRFICGDGLYYLSSEGFCRLFADHPGLKKGLTFFMSGRHFAPEPESLNLDRFVFQERAACTIVRTVDRTEKVNIFTSAGKPVLTSAKKAVVKNGKTIKDAVEGGVPMFKHIKHHTVVESQVPALPAMDVVEGHGLVDAGGVITYFASTSAGDSVYKHSLHGMFFFTCQKKAESLMVDGVLRHFQISCHQEWACQTLSVLRVQLQELEVPGINIQVNRVPDAFVQSGIVTSILSNLCIKGAGIEMTKPESLKALYECAFRQMVSSLGKANHAKLVQYHDFLFKASRRTADKALLLSRVTPIQGVPMHSSFKDIAERRAVEEIVDETHVAPGLAATYVHLTAKQTRAEFLIQAVRALYEGCQWIWEKIRAYIAGLSPAALSVPGQIVDLIAALKRNSKKFSGFVDKLLSPITSLGSVRNALLKVDSWMSKYPMAKAVFEEVAFAAQCIIVAFGEEYMKRTSTAGFAALFGALEALLYTVSYHIDHPASKESIARCITIAVTQVISHTFMRLLPMWVAVPLHALHNYIVSRHKPRLWTVLIELLREADLNNFAGDVDDFEVVPVSVPANVVAESKVFLKNEDGSRHYIADDPQFLQLLSVEEKGQKVMSVVSDASRLLVRPSGSILDMVLMEVKRLNKPLPYVAQKAAWASAWAMFAQSFLDPLFETQGYLHVYDGPELIQYVTERPWTTARKEDTIAIIRKWKSEGKLSRPKAITPKVDEVIPNQPDFVESTEFSASKTRPICPREEADLPAMAIAVPLKKYIGGQRFWRWEGFAWVPVGDPEAETAWMLSIDYQYAPRADRLTDWFCYSSNFKGIHFAMHGDDQYCLLVDEELNASAIDLSNCDKTCGEEFQKYFCTFLNAVTDDSHEEDVKRQFDLLVGEFQLKSRHFPMGTPPIFWAKEEISTNTGEPLTSVKAVFAQYVAIFTTVARCMVNGVFKPALYKEAVLSVWKQLGLIPEFETNSEGEVWHHPSAVTYLGGMFAETIPDTCSSWAWVSNKHIKAYFLFPAVQKIYGGPHPCEMHMLTLLQDPDLQSGPVGRALSKWYERCTRRVFPNWENASLRAQQQWENHLMQTDRYKLEQKMDLGDYETPTISDHAYYHAAEQMLERNGSEFNSHSIMAVVEEIKTFAASPVQVLSNSAIALYTLRFGVPKARTMSEDSLPELNLMSAIFDLSAKIFCVFYKNNIAKMSTKKQKTGKPKAPKKKSPAKTPKTAAPQKQRSMAAAYDPSRVQVGLGKRGRETVSWVAGTVYIGNGALGANDSVYFRPTGAAVVLVGTASGAICHVPVAGSDSVVGNSYLTDMAKHFARKRVYRQWITLRHISSSTANDATVIVAPIAGPGTVASTVSYAAAVTTGANLTSIESMQGNQPVACYRDATIDMTSYIRGGAGPKQNEFNISAVGTTTTAIGSGVDQAGTVGSAFAIGGNNTTVALRGANTHTVVITQEIEFIDWLGTSATTDSIALLSLAIEKAHIALAHHVKWLAEAHKERSCENVEGPACRQLSVLRKQIRSAGEEPPETAFCPSGCPSCVIRERIEGKLK